MAVIQRPNCPLYNDQKLKLGLLPTVHTIVAAKKCVTVDHISNGRFGLNIVMGWFTPEMVNASSWDGAGIRWSALPSRWLKS